MYERLDLGFLLISLLFDLSAVHAICGISISTFLLPQISFVAVLKLCKPGIIHQDGLVISHFRDFFCTDGDAFLFFFFFFFFL